MRSVIGKCLLAASLIGAAPAWAHHSPAQFDLSRKVTFDGTVTEFEWKNPHVFIQVETVDADGGVSSMQVEADGISILVPAGWSADSLATGDRVHVVAHPARSSARHTALGYSITKQDGTVLAPNPDQFRGASPVSATKAAGIAGVWMPRWEEGFFAVGANSASLALTERGKQYRNAPEAARNSQVNCVPFAAPRIMAYPVYTQIEVASDRVLIHVDWLAAERVVYTDGRGHPEDGARSVQGHTIGRWEGDTLVMDTTLFSEASRDGITGLPSGPRKRIEERLSPGADGKTLRYAFVLEDPDYLLAPVTGTAVWDYRPDLEPTAAECDLEAARRFLEPVE